MSELRGLRIGDIIQSTVTHLLYVVTSSDSDHVTATITVDITRPSEWRLASKARHPMAVAP